MRTYHLYATSRTVERRPSPLNGLGSLHDGSPIAVVLRVLYVGRNRGLGRKVFTNLITPTMLTYLKTWPVGEVLWQYLD
jgi:hypothetical protein